MYKIFLASTSPRRKALIQKLHGSFEVVGLKPQLDESAIRYRDPESYVMNLSYLKARSVAEEAGEGLIFAADTVVVRDGVLLEKPGSLEEARQMLRSLSGRSHEVYTGYTLTDGKRTETDYDVARVSFSALSDGVISMYLAENTYQDKAGAYGIQDVEELFGASVEGDRDTVVGLPVVKVDELLARWREGRAGGKGAPLRTQTLKELPRESLPEERLLRLGAEALGDEELLAIFLRTGRPGQTVVELAGELLYNLQGKYGYEGLGSLKRANFHDYTSLLGIGDSKAARLLAITEIHKRMGKAERRSQKLDSPKKAADYYFDEMSPLDVEEFRVVGLDTKKHVLLEETISRGMVDATLLSPREVFAGVVARKCHSILLYHNHPTGVVAPSREDDGLTRRLVEAGRILNIPVNDHIIIGDGPERYYSYLEQGRLL
ncbi:MAG: DNA repair protein RadC [Tissierellia bacterium]|nr:DNA repair protein RadC [Tissierellia bacterium]